MRSFYLILPMALSLLLLIGCQNQPDSRSTQTAAEPSTPEKAQVQSVMRTFIDDQHNGILTVDNRQTTFGYLHESLKTKDGMLVSCADFTAGDDVYDVDLYVESTGRDLEVVKTIFHKKNGQPVDEVLWTKDVQ